MLNKDTFNISQDEIQEAVKKALTTSIKDQEHQKLKEVGYVTFASDSIVHISGLPSVTMNEFIELDNGVRCLVVDLDKDKINAVVLDDINDVKEGQAAYRTKQIVSIPVGDQFLGRMVNGLGVPIDNQGKIATNENRLLELQAPTVMQRASIKEPLQTGIKAIDAITPIGKGQRQLIIGDRQVGKTTIAIDTIINQKQNWATNDPSQQVRCIYVAIGQKASTIASIYNTLQNFGAMEYTTIVCALPSESPGLRYLAPYAGSALGQHWMYQGKHALIVFDDLSKHAEAYRTISLLLKHPPGREAYPGDVFYLHSRLLERCAKLSDEMGGGSLSGLPIIETKENDISAYIPTNVISITDGQCFLESNLFHANIKPAINIGLSVSRVGGAAQIKAMKRVAGQLRGELAQYRDLEAFASLGSDLDVTSQKQLNRGMRIIELLKQLHNTPYHINDQVITIWLGVVSSELDDIPVNEIKTFEINFLEYLHINYKNLYELLDKHKDITDEITNILLSACKEYKKNINKYK